MATDLQRAWEAIAAKNKPYTDYFGYYDGVHPLMYTNSRLKEIFENLDARFTENWCAVVIDACNEKINLSGFKTTDATAQAALTELYAANELATESDELHEASQVIGEAFLVVWPSEDGEPAAYLNDPRLCHVFYDNENPRQATFAAKRWVDADGKWRVTLYYPDRLEYYITRGDAKNITSYKALISLEPEIATNTYGKIPVFHFRIKKRLTKSDLENVVPIQNGINKLLTDMMVAAEYGAFKQRWIISNADGLGKLRNAPNEVWTIPSGDTQGQGTSVGQFEATDLANYLNAIDRLASAIAVITRTPKHYLFSQGGDPSGEALIAMEAPLNRKAQDRIDRFTATWQQAAAFMLQIMGITVKPQDITPLFDKPETVQPMTQAQVRQATVAAGVPLKTSLRWEGRSEEEIKAMEKDKQEEQTQQAAMLGQELARAQRQFDQGNNGNQTA